MPVTVIIEDGSNVANSNSYITVDEAIQYCEERGVTLANTGDVAKIKLIKAKDYLETFGNKYQGQKTNFAQALQWPRSEVYLYGNPEPISITSIPYELKQAQCAAVLALESGFDLMPNITASDYVIEETVGPVTTKFADPVKTGIAPTPTNVLALLEPLFGQVSKGFSLRTIRV